MLPDNPGPGEFASLTQWEKALRREFLTRLNQRIEFSSEDIRAVVGMPPEAHPNRFGLSWRLMLREFEDDLRVVGIRKSSVASARGRLLPIYQRRASK